MIIVYPTINGKKTKHEFYESWEEVPITAFVHWQNMVPEMEAIENDINEINNGIIKESKMYERYHFQGRTKQAKRVLKRITTEQKKVDKLMVELNKVEVSALSHFTTVPLIHLLQMQHQQNEEEEITDNHIRRYKNRLLFLATSPLPTDAMSKFRFQSRTDEYIDELEKDRDKLSKLNIVGRKRKQKFIDAVKSYEYEVKDIWEQTTSMNKELQELANDIIEEMQNGEFDSLPYLIAMLTVEDNFGSEELTKMTDTNDAKAYVEKYMEEVKEIFQERVKIFTEQKIKLSIADAIRIKNFFLTKSMIS